jgi:hypothetical protein
MMVYCVVALITLVTREYIFLATLNDDLRLGQNVVASPMLGVESKWHRGCLDTF